MPNFYYPPPRYILILLCSLSLWTGSTLALTEDSSQPIHIIADEAVRDERTGQTIYRGNVQINQGSLEIDADVVTVYRIEVEADKIVAEGSPAHMKQKRQADGEYVYAEGDTIEYYKQEERLHLLSNAQLKQDGSTVKGDRIDYFITQELVKASADQSQGNGRRVEIIIPAKKVEQLEEE